MLDPMVKYSRLTLDMVLSALADNTPRRLLERLSQGEASVSQLARPFGASLPAIYKHLRVLERPGFIAHEKRGHVRHVRLTAQCARNGGEWMRERIGEAAAASRILEKRRSPAEGIGQGGTRTRTRISQNIKI